MKHSGDSATVFVSLLLALVCSLLGLLLLRLITGVLLRRSLVFFGLAVVAQFVHSFEQALSELP